MDMVNTPDARPQWLGKLAEAITQRNVSLKDVAGKLQAKGHRLKHPLQDMLQDVSKMGKDELYALVDAVSPLGQWKQRNEDNALFINDALKWAAEQNSKAGRPVSKQQEQKPKKPVRVSNRTLQPAAATPLAPTDSKEVSPDFQEVIGLFHNQQFARDALFPITNGKGTSINIARSVELLLTYADPKEAIASEDLFRKLSVLCRRDAPGAFGHIRHAEVDYGLKREAFLTFFPEEEQRGQALQELNAHGLLPKQVEPDRWRNNDSTRKALADLKPRRCIDAAASRFSAALSDLMDAAQSYHEQKRLDHGRSR